MIVQKGLGTVPPASSLISTGLTTGTAVATATGATASLLAAIGIGAQFVPIVGTIVGGIALVIGALGLGNGCGATCTASTTVVNDIEPYMKQNLAAAQAQAQANGGCLTSAEVSTLEGNWNTLWQYVVSNCQKVGGVGGNQCISDRSPGGKYDWTSYYLTPIQQIPVCSATSAGAIEGDVSSVASDLNIPVSWLMIGGLGLAALLVLD